MEIELAPPNLELLRMMLSGLWAVKDLPDAPGRPYPKEIYDDAVFVSDAFIRSAYGIHTATQVVSNRISGLNRDNLVSLIQAATGLKDVGVGTIERDSALRGFLIQYKEK